MRKGGGGVVKGEGLISVGTEYLVQGCRDMRIKCLSVGWYEVKLDKSFDV